MFKKVGSTKSAQKCSVLMDPVLMIIIESNKRAAVTFTCINIPFHLLCSKAMLHQFWGCWFSVISYAFSFALFILQTAFKKFSLIVGHPVELVVLSKGTRMVG